LRSTLETALDCTSRQMAQTEEIQMNFEDNKLPKGSYHLDLRKFRMKKVTFKPTGPVCVVPCGGEEHRDANPAKRLQGAQRSARMFVGLSVGNKPTHTVDDVVAITRRVRQAQGADPSSSFLLQRGVYQGSTGVVEEDSVQVVILDFGTKAKLFEKQMVELAETLARELQQEVVYVEMQRNGVRTVTLEVVE
jgi:hypothetical protein